MKTHLPNVIELGVYFALESKATMKEFPDALNISVKVPAEDHVANQTYFQHLINDIFKT